MDTPRTPYPSDVTDEEWAFVAPYLTPMTLVAPQREHDLREVFDALLWLVRTGSPRRYPPNAPALRLPPGRSSTGRRSAGRRPAASRRSSTTCGPCCGWRRGGIRSRRR